MMAGVMRATPPGGRRGSIGVVLELVVLVAFREPDPDAADPDADADSDADLVIVEDADGAGVAAAEFPLVAEAVFEF